MIFAGLELLGEVPFTDVIIHSTVLAPDGRRMSKSLGTGIDPLEVIEQHGADATRYGLLKISSAQDVRFSYGAIEEGRKLANKLWNASRLLLQDARRRGRAAAVVARGALDPRADRRGARGDRGGSRRVRLLARRRPPLPPDLRRLLRLVSRGDQAAARRATRRAGDGARGARAAADAAASRDAARDRGDLDAPARARDAADRRAVARARCRRTPATRTRSSACRRRRERFRRSGVRTPLEGDELRIFEAVVRPERVKVERQRAARGGGRAARGRDRAQREDARRTSGSSRTRAARSSQAEREKLERYRRELDAIRS